MKSAFISVAVIFIFSILSTSCSFVQKKLEARKQKETNIDTSASHYITTTEDPVLLQIRSLEKQLKIKREKEHYSKLLPWFKSDQERLDYLLLSSFQEKQQWALDKKMWNRSQNPSDNMKAMIITGDIAIGMPMDFVLKSWGEPQSREISGQPLFKNERWKYSRQISTREGYKLEKRLVYFEGGRVVGWETL